MKGLTGLIASFIFALSTAPLAQSLQQPTTNASSPIHSDTLISSNAQTTISKQESELLLIKEQNRLIKDFQSAQQATVYWALGGILSFVVILTGLSIFTNFKLYDQDKERLRAEFEEKISNYRTELNLRAEEYMRESDKSTETKNQTLQDRLLTQLSEIRVSLENIRSELITDMKLLDSKTSIFESEVKRDVAAAEANLRDVEVLVWDLRGIPSNMLITHSQAITSAVLSDNKSRVSHMLSQLRRTLEDKYGKTGLPVDADGFKYVDESLDKAKTIDPDGVTKAREILSGLVIEPTK